MNRLTRYGRQTGNYSGRGMLIFGALLLAGLSGCTSRAAVPIFIPAPNPIPIKVVEKLDSTSHPVVRPLIADSASPLSGPISALPDEIGRIPAEDILTVDVHQGEINALAAAPGGRTAYSGGNDGLVIQTALIGEFRLQLPGTIAAVETTVLLQGDKPIQGLAIDTKGKVLAVSQYGAVIVYDLETREIVARLTRLDGRVTAISWDSRGELLALGRADGGLFVWNVFKGPHAGEDSLDAVEKYNGGSSPIERIIFHPSARIFMALEKKGIVGLWRLARTEYEMGLRDDAVVLNQPQLGIRRWTYLQLPSLIEDFGVSSNGKFLHLTMANGKTIQWKIRGLKAADIVGFPEQNSYQLAELALNAAAGRTLYLLSTTGRTETLAFWCQSRASDTTAPRLAADDSSAAGTSGGEGGDEGDNGQADSVPEDPTTVSIINEYSDVSGSVAAAEPFIPEGTVIKPVWRSAQLRQPLKAIDMPPRSGLLWASQKTGNLLVFKLNSLLTSAAVEKYQQQCKAP